MKADYGRERTPTEALAIDILLAKQDLGAEKYGRGIDYRHEGYKWIDECIEELADGLQYAVAAKMFTKRTCADMLIVLGHLRSDGEKNDKEKLCIDTLENLVRALMPD